MITRKNIYAMIEFFKSQDKDLECVLTEEEIILLVALQLEHSSHFAPIDY